MSGSLALVVIGGAGMIGRRIVDEALARGQPFASSRVIQPRSG